MCHMHDGQYTTYNVLFNCSARPRQNAAAALEKTEYRAGQTALRKQDRLLHDLVAHAKATAKWVDPSIRPVVMPQKHDDHDGSSQKQPDVVELQLDDIVSPLKEPEEDTIAKIVVAEDHVVSTDDGTKVLVKVGHTLAIETDAAGKLMFHDFILFPGQHDFLDEGILASVAEVQAEQDSARKRMTMAESCATDRHREGWNDPHAAGHKARDEDCAIACKDPKPIRARRQHAAAC